MTLDRTRWTTARPSSMLPSPRTSGGIGRRTGFRFRRRKAWGFKSLLVHSLTVVIDECLGPSARLRLAGRWQVPPRALPPVVIEQGLGPPKCVNRLLAFGVCALVLAMQAPDRRDPARRVGRKAESHHLSRSSSRTTAFGVAASPVLEPK